jgi:hypothetical protein
MIRQKADQERSALRAQSQSVIGVAVSGHLVVAACGQIAMAANMRYLRNSWTPMCWVGTADRVGYSSAKIGAITICRPNEGPNCAEQSAYLIHRIDPGSGRTHAGFRDH